jgi:hypothetical protein
MNTQMIRLLLAIGLSAAFAGTSPTLAQTTLGGAKTQQNKIGGVAKPAPVVGGAVIQTPPPPLPPKPMFNTFKPATPGVVAPSTTTSATLGQPPGLRPNPPVTPPKPVVTSNLKCANGVCISRGAKP